MALVAWGCFKTLVSHKQGGLVIDFFVHSCILVSQYVHQGI